jgi:hypothetical protein
MGLFGQKVTLNKSYSDPTSFGWSYSSQVFVAGQDKQSAGGWTNFTEGKCLHFVLKKTKLTMFSTSKNICFVIDNVPSVAKKTFISILSTWYQNYIGTLECK